MASSLNTSKTLDTVKHGRFSRFYGQLVMITINLATHLWITSYEFFFVSCFSNKDLILVTGYLQTRQDLITVEAISKCQSEG